MPEIPFPQESEIELHDWDSFELELKNLRQVRESRAIPSSFLFRGHGDSAWKLETTLERRGRKEMRFDEYYRLISRMKPQTEAFSKKLWEIVDYPEIEKLVQGYDEFSRDLTFGRFPAYDYMIYLRHHRFPSPLLDWSRSPYIAAFFAFSAESKPCTGQVSIYAFLEKPEGYKGFSSGKALIHRLGPYVRSHPRHFLQQAEYTVCLTDNPWRFGNHEDVIARGELQQDRLWKFILPWSERKKVLRMLAEYNLNAFSLFQSEEGPSWKLWPYSNSTNETRQLTGSHLTRGRFGQDDSSIVRSIIETG